MPSLKWLGSYETIKFDTADGELHKGQYARDGDNIYIRNKPENNAQFSLFDYDNLLTVEERARELSTMTEVHILPNEHLYFDEYALPDGRVYREKSDEKSYKDLALKDAKPKTKNITNAEIAKIKKDDGKWL